MPRHGANRSFAEACLQGEVDDFVRLPKDASDGDAIEFDAAPNGQTITLTSDKLVIDKDILIDGSGPATPKRPRVAAQGVRERLLYSRRPTVWWRVSR